MRSPADYGLDAPGVVIGLVLGGVAFLALGPRIPGLGWLVWPGLFLVAEALLMIVSSLYGKRVERDRLLRRVALEGDETVLDVGCGSGLLLVGAARNLPEGLAVGVDLWSRRDLSGNRPEVTRANASAEGVEDRVEVCTGDARELPFADGSFHVVLSSLALHTIHSGAERRRAVAEIARVVGPGGRIALLDIRHTGQYARALRDRGFVVERSRPHLGTFPPSRQVVARRDGRPPG
ncbi:MAG TPA: class I SAM-dependent methyltransferase [Gemmatimonadota bacterium]|nr:class I SAM-dependent methyltransferase [Gemmatimonadota bacterium]